MHRSHGPLPDFDALSANVLAFVRAYKFSKHLNAPRWRHRFLAICDAPARAVLMPPERVPPAAALDQRVREDSVIRHGARGKMRRIDVERVPPGAETKSAALLLEGL